MQQDAPNVQAVQEESGQEARLVAWASLPELEMAFRQVGSQRRQVERMETVAFPLEGRQACSVAGRAAC
jgi:hypothetical protein